MKTSVHDRRLAKLLRVSVEELNDLRLKTTKRSHPFGWLEEQTRAAVARLPPQLGLVLQLGFGIDGEPKHSIEEIARVLGVKSGQVRLALSHALRALMYGSEYPVGFSYYIDLGLAALRTPQQPNPGLADVIESVKRLTPELIDHLRSNKEDLRKIKWDVLEHLVGECLAQQGFRDVRLVGRDPRTSADIYATWVIDATGMVFRFFIEVKRWKKRVGVQVINEVLGAMLSERERFGWHAGMIISTGGFADGRFSMPELSLKGIELRVKEDLLRWLDNYRPNKNGLWLPAPERAIPPAPTLPQSTSVYRSRKRPHGTRGRARK